MAPLKPMQGLQQQRSFPDAGVAADQDDRSGHDAAAEYPIEFGQAGGKTDFLGDGYFIDRRRRFPVSGRLPATLPNGAFLFQGIPLPAIRATSGPPWRLTATFLADKNRTRLTGFHKRRVQPQNRRRLQLFPDFFP